jgi:hypothetical protein
MAFLRCARSKVIQTCLEVEQDRAQVLPGVLTSCVTGRTESMGTRRRELKRKSKSASTGSREDYEGSQGSQASLFG